MTRTHWLDRVTAPIAPGWTLKRQRARIASDLLMRHYEAASAGRRTQGWRKSSGDANAVIGPALTTLRENARDLVRNNPYAESAVSTIADHTVGWGIHAKPSGAVDAWRRYAESISCDADGRHDFYGLQKLIMRTVVESGEVLVRRRFRLPSDGFEIPMQIQVLDPDFLDTSRDTLNFGTSRSGGDGGPIIQGVEFDLIGRRVAYWLFRDHPGSMLSSFQPSVRVPAESVLHVFKPTRPGQVRAASWFAPVMLALRDFDEFADATLMKQKIAACLAVLTTDLDGSAPALGAIDPASPTIDSLQPGMIENLPPGRSVTVIDPPSVRDYDAYTTTVLRSIATGLGVTYEDLTGDYKDMPFSAARMSRLRHEARIHDWRWRILIPQFCDPVFRWFGEAAVIVGQARSVPTATWTPPPFPMVDPAAEGLAVQRNVRTGITSLSEAIRERGFDPDDLFAEMASDNAKLDRFGLVLDSDARRMTQAGQAQSVPAAGVPLPTAARDASGERPHQQRINGGLVP
jgi:lambda family phage portal protein